MKEVQSYYERKLLEEISRLEEQIRNLSHEKMALQRQLVKARNANTSLSKISRVNSANRILVEECVLKELGKTNRPLSMQKLYQRVKEINFDLKEGTFRTQLHRMKKKGLIMNSNKSGVWKLPPPADSY